MTHSVSVEYVLVGLLTYGVAASRYNAKSVFRTGSKQEDPRWLH